MCGCVAGLLPVQDPQGSVWLSHNVPIILPSCFSAVIDSYCRRAAPPARRGRGPPEQSCSQVEPGGRDRLQSPRLPTLIVGSKAVGPSSSQTDCCH